MSVDNTEVLTVAIVPAEAVPEPAKRFLTPGDPEYHQSRWQRHTRTA